MKILVFVTLLLVASGDFTLQGNNLFTAHVYKEVTKTSAGNFIVSPLSVETVLALTQSGARGATKFEILAGLSLPNSTSATENAFKELLLNLHGNENYKLHAANKIYVQENYPVNDDFARTAKDIYQAETENVNFALKQATSEKINKWVEAETDGKIKDLISSESLSEELKVILVNALFFKGKWVSPFNPSRNVEKDFFVSDGSAVKVEMMQSKSGEFNYCEDSALDARFLELPFVGGDVSLILILPNKKDGLRHLEAGIEKIFEEKKFALETVDVVMPKFSIGNKINLKSILENLGIKKLFDSHEADLSGISGNTGELFVSEVLQESFINVTEVGTEAASAAAVFVELESLPLPGKYQFEVDRPFMFYLKAKGVVIVVGRVQELKNN